MCRLQMARGLTRLLFSIPASQEKDGSREQSSLDAPKEEACRQHSFKGLDLGHADDQATPDPYDSRQIDRRSQLDHDHVGRDFA
jgi:hypothetical protein